MKLMVLRLEIRDANHGIVHTESLFGTYSTRIGYKRAFTAALNYARIIWYDRFEAHAYYTYEMELYGI